MMNIRTTRVKRVIPSIGLALLMSSCSEHIPNKHEQRYLDAIDSLKMYRTAPYLEKELAANEKTRDLLELSYEDFKDKYDWNDEEMDVFSDIIQGHVQVAKLLDRVNNITEEE